MSVVLNLDCEFALLGKMQRNYILPYNHRPVMDAPGGNLLYSAAGCGLWSGKAGLVARVSADYPITWLDPLLPFGFDLQGIKQGPDLFDMRWFVAYAEDEQTYFDNPLNHYARLGLPLPHALLGYENNFSKLCSKTSYDFQSLRINDIPLAYRDVKAAHICPIDFMTHKTVPSILKAGRVQTLSMSSHPGYMDPLFWNEIPILLSDLVIFFTSESEVISLFQGRSVDLWDIAEQLVAYGPEFIVIQLRTGGCLLYDRVSRRKWKIPPYTVNVVDPTGLSDSFAGAFLVVYQRTFDPLKAALAGTIAASFTQEGSDPFYALSALPGLKEARLDFLTEKVVEV